MKKTFQKYSRLFRFGLLALLIFAQAASLSRAYGNVVWHHHHNAEPLSAHGEPRLSDAPVVVPAVHSQPNRHVSEGHEHHAHVIGQAVPLISPRQSFGIRPLGTIVWAKIVTIGLETVPELHLYTGVSYTLLTPEPATRDFDPTRSPPVVA